MASDPLDRGYLLLRVGDQPLAVPCSQVIELQAAPEPGGDTPSVDLAEALGLGRRPTRAAYRVLARTPTGVVTYEVDEALEHVPAERARVLTLPSLVRNAALARGIMGALVVDDSVCLLLDLAALAARSARPAADM